MTLPALPPRPVDSHKGDYGRALLIGGSQGMAGAIAMSAMAALRSGAGLVTVATASSCLDTVASFHPAYMTVPLPADAAGRIAGEAIDRAIQLAVGTTCVGMGPGLGQSDGICTLVNAVYQQIDVPVVVDADGINALAHCAQMFGIREVLRPNSGGQRVFTPHVGELRRLIGEDVALQDIQSRAIKFAEDYDVVIALKGSQTTVAGDGRVYQNTTGNPGMATAGSGDVLTGVITGLVCQGLTPFDAACLGVYLHGLAGDLAAAEKGLHSMIATDICDYLPAAFQNHLASNGAR